MRPVLVEGVARHYDWGSPTVVPRLLGIGEDGRPWAELWFGTHPHAPSRVPSREVGLDELIASDPGAALGPACVEQFGPQLPFLVKILAARTPLSIQVHPDRAQAIGGAAAEDAAGIPRDAPERNYRDANHKPELICALTPFEALCGFRPVARTRAVLEESGVAELDFLLAALDGPDPLRAAFEAVLLPRDPATVTAAVAAVSAAADVDGPLRPAALAARDFPGDVGVVLTLLLNHVMLAPGEAIFLGAGNVHAYLHGTGVEIMAVSDNVLRCGLTAKHVDPAELLRITDFRALEEPRWPGAVDGFVPPVPDFALEPVDVSRPGPAGRPALVLATTGPVSVLFGSDVVEAPPGRAVFVPADVPDWSVSTDGAAFVATPGH